MKRISLISDTHGYFGEDVNKYLRETDEIWHAGDIGDMDTLKKYESLGRPFRAVYGNIDDQLVRRSLPEILRFDAEGVHILMLHIGGYPGRYSSRARQLIRENRPDLLICGHSHITRIIRDPVNQLIHMNPGSCGQQGFHQVRTLIRFSVHEGSISGVEVVELGRRGRLG
jgi:putative phosphoesterase